LPLRRKLLRLASLICGIVLTVSSIFFIFHVAFGEFPNNFNPMSSSDAEQQFWIHTYSLILGLFLFIAGFVLVVASYYHRQETNLPMKI
jgi:heme/copper-type cytochrome/quinol oxidase subunit 2